MMLGNRAGLQPWGRDRMAQIWYSKAQEQIDKGNKEKAIMYTDWALNTSRKFIEAINLREKLTNKKMEEAVAELHRGFVRRRAQDRRREHSRHRQFGSLSGAGATPDVPATHAK